MKVAVQSFPLSVSSDVTWTCKSVEHGYQALKYQGKGLHVPAQKILNAPTSLDAKKLNTKFKHDKSIGPVQLPDSQVSEAMKQVLRAKFTSNPVLKRLLLETSPKHLHEVPGRSKNVWAYASGDRLGLLLTEVRDELALI